MADYINKGLRANNHACDWDMARNEFITGDMTFKTLAEKYGVTMKAVSIRANSEKWRIRREEYRRKVSNDALNKVAKEETAKQAEQLKKLCFITEQLENEVERCVKDPGQLQKWLVQNTHKKKGATETVTEEKTFTKFDTRAIRDLARTAETLTQLKRSLHGLFDASEERRAQVERERLELERERLELEKERLQLQVKREENEKNADNVTIVVGGYNDAYSE